MGIDPLGAIGNRAAIGQAGGMARNIAENGGNLTLPHLVKWVELVVRAHMERTIRDLPVSGSQLLVLVLLDERGEATSAEIARMLHVTPQAMTTTLRPLRTGGMIQGRTDTAHGRRILLSLTKSGRSVIEQARALSPALEEELLAGFTEDETRTLKYLLSRIALRLE